MGSEIEAAVLSHPEVLAAAVIAVKVYVLIFNSDFVKV
jgi:acyl-coenzyme A synthetase/AMP-(fatty) acid ligase